MAVSQRTEGSAVPAEQEYPTTPYTCYGCFKRIQTKDVLPDPLATYGIPICKACEHKAAGITQPTYTVAPDFGRAAANDFTPESRVPDAVLQSVFSLLPAEDLGRSMCVSTRWSGLAKEDRLWKGEKAARRAHLDRFRGWKLPCGCYSYECDGYCGPPVACRSRAHWYLHNPHAKLRADESPLVLAELKRLRKHKH